MKLHEIINLNKPQIKVEVHNKKGGNPRMLLIQDLSSEDIPAQIKEIVQRITAKYIDGKATLKLIAQEPVTFNVVPAMGREFYRFVVGFPPGSEDIQKGLITAISNFSAT